MSEASWTVLSWTRLARPPVPFEPGLIIVVVTARDGRAMLAAWDDALPPEMGDHVAVRFDDGVARAHV